MNKNIGGFTYVEIVIAAAVFLITVGVVFFAVNQAGRNLEYARESYKAHLAAQRLMLTVRDSFRGGLEEICIDEHARQMEISEFTVWIAGEYIQSFRSPNAPEAAISITGIREFDIAGNTFIIMVAVWNEHNYPAGRAIGAVVVRCKLDE